VSDDDEEKKKRRLGDRGDRVLWPVTKNLREKERRWAAWWMHWLRGGGTRLSLPVTIARSLTSEATIIYSS
jgi:glutathione S-transferase